MNKELFVIIISWSTSIFSLLKFVPKERMREAHISFLFSQSIAWMFELIQVHFGLIEFPYREFHHATKLSFSLHYILLPTFGVFFILLYPLNKGKKRKLFHYLIFSSVVPMYTTLVEHFTSLIEYKNWNWFIATCVNLIFLWFLQKFVFWFRKEIY